MISKYKYKGLTWVDLESPTEEEILHTIEEYSITSAVVEELKTASLQSRVELYPNFIYLILSFPEISHKGYKSYEKEIDFIIGKDFLITAHYESVESLLEFSKTFEVESILDKNTEINHAGLLFFSIIKSLYSNSISQLESVDLLIKEIEKKMFHGNEGKMVEKISNTNRVLLDFRQAVRFHKDILDRFDSISRHFFGESLNGYVPLIIQEHNKIQSILNGQKEILNDLRETNDSLLANKTKEGMKMLTIITFLGFPITIISSIFVINANFLEDANINDYYLVLGLMLVSSVIAFAYIKKKKWL